MSTPEGSPFDADRRPDIDFSERQAVSLLGTEGEEVNLRLVEYSLGLRTNLDLGNASGRSADGTLRLAIDAESGDALGFPRD